MRRKFAKNPADSIRRKFLIDAPRRDGRHASRASTISKPYRACSGNPTFTIYAKCSAQSARKALRTYGVLSRRGTP
jgi:hypothetical protein